MVSMVDPQDVKPGEVWSVDPLEGNSGEWIGVRLPGGDVPWRLCRTGGEGLRYADDSEVVLRHRMVEARPVTRADLPLWVGMNTLYWSELDSSKARVSPMATVLDAVVECLNNAGGLGVDAREPLEQALRERDEWKAHAVAHTKGANRANLDRDTAYEELTDMASRAENAERELADEYSQANQDAAAWNHVKEHPALRMDLLPEADHTYAGRVFERITWLAETAEAVTEMKPAPAVSRADVAKALARCLDPERWNLTFPALVNEICDLFGVEAEQATDPLLDKAQEFAALADWELTDREAELLHKVAAHVLGQEGRHVDQ